MTVYLKYTFNPLYGVFVNDEVPSDVLMHSHITGSVADMLKQMPSFIGPSILLHTVSCAVVIEDDINIKTAELMLRFHLLNTADPTIVRAKCAVLVAYSQYDARSFLPFIRMVLNYKFRDEIAETLKLQQEMGTVGVIGL